MKTPLKIAFLTSEDPKDKKSWSGTYNRMFTVLSNEFETVTALGPQNNLFLKGLGIINFILKRTINKGYNDKHSIIRSKILGILFSKKLQKDKYDIIFAPAASTETAFLRTKIPIVYLSDSSFAQLKDYYYVFTNLLSFSQKESNFIENKALKKASGFIYPSNWAADFVIENYNVMKEKVVVIPFGANIDNEYLPEKINKSISANKPFSLLFIGVNWERKGGNIVMETFELLLSEGYDVTLTVCGCAPSKLHSKIRTYTFLNKNLESDLIILTNIYKESNLLFVPTRADCSPIIFCEANAFGLPVLSSNTGGVTEIIEDGINGFCLEYKATPRDYANTIISMMKDKEGYEKLCKTSKEKYDKELNWNSWVYAVKNFFFSVLKNKP